jgi:hypothetical protein
MPRLSSLIAGFLVLMSGHMWAQAPPCAPAFEIGARAEITLAKPYYTAEGVRIEVPWTELAGKETLTLAAGGRERPLHSSVHRGRVQGVLAAVDDTWLTFDLGETQPVLRIPRGAVVRIVRSEAIGLPAQDTASPLSGLGCAGDAPDAAAFEAGQTVEITLAEPYRTREGVRIQVPWAGLDGGVALTLRAGGREKTVAWPGEPGRVQGLLTAVDDAWLTLDRGGEQPHLRIPREAIAQIVRRKTYDPPAQEPAPPPAPLAEPQDGEPYPVPFEVGEKVEIALAEAYRTAGGVRVKASWTELAGKPLMTVAARGQEGTRAEPTDQARVRGLLTAVDGAWLTLNPGGRQPFLRIPGKAIVRIAAWDGLLPQDSGSLSSGQEVRLVSTELGRGEIAGNLLAFDDKTLLVKVAGRAEPVRLRRSSIERLNVLRRRNGSRTGAVAGAIALGIPGAALGVIMSGLACFGVEGGCHHDPRGGAVAGFVVSAVVGASIGGVIGRASKSERWERVPLSVVIAPQRRGARAALTLRF